MDAPQPSNGSSAPANALANEPCTIIFENVSLAFDENVVLEDVSFKLHRGETKILFGVAGSGKSVLLKLALGLFKPDAGHIYVLGHDVTEMKE